MSAAALTDKAWERIAPALPTDGKGQNSEEAVVKEDTVGDLEWVLSVDSISIRTRTTPERAGCCTSDVILPSIILHLR